MKKKIKKIVTLLLITICLYAYYNSEQVFTPINNLIEQIAENSWIPTQSKPNDISNSISTDIAKITFLDVGQGDSSIIQLNDIVVLIDTGKEEATDEISSYLDTHSINQIDYLILTHPHEDHIGGAEYLIETYDIDTIYMQQLSATTKVCKSLIQSIKENKCDVQTPKIGSSLPLDNATLEFLGPLSISEEMNNNSIVVKFTYNQNSILFMGDAEQEEELEVMKKYDVSADIIKLGHHGSSSSSDLSFLKEVNPQYAIISAGENNDYGHPHKETLKTLKTLDITFYRTDQYDNISVKIEGDKLVVAP